MLPIRRATLCASVLFLAFLLPALAASPCGTTPAGLTILSCAPFNIINTQSSPTPSGFQQLVQNFPYNALAGNFVVYNSLSGALVPAWIENSNTVWLNLGGNTIPADGSANGIYAFGFGSASAFFLGNQIGEAPQLSATYGEYDNGNTVFPFYENWAGSSTPSNYGGFDVGSCVTQNNEVVLSLGSSSCYIATKLLWPATSANIVDVYADIAPSSPGAVGAGYASCAIGTGTSCGTNSGSTQEGAFMGAISGCSICGILSEQGPLASTSSSLSTANKWEVYSTEWTSATAASYLTDYGSPLSITGASGTSTSAPIGYVSQGSGAGTITSYWIRLRTAPPAGVMPSVDVGNAVPNGVSVQSWKASINPIIIGEQQTLTANLLDGSPPYTYNFLVYNAIGTLVSSASYATSLTVNSFSYAQQSAWGAGAFTANIGITDSAGDTASASLAYTATAPSSLSCSSGVFRYPFLSSSVYENPAASQNTLIVTGIASGNESFYIGSSSSRPLIASVYGGGHNESYALTVPPGNYFAVNFTATPLFTVQCVGVGAQGGGGTTFLNLPSNNDSMIPLATETFAAMWIVFGAAMVFFREGEDKRTLLLASAAVLAVLSIFTSMVPFKQYSEIPNVTTDSGSGTSIMHAFNITQVSAVPTSPEQILYMAFIILLATIFGTLAMWSFKKRLTIVTQPFQRGMQK